MTELTDEERRKLEEALDADEVENGECIPNLLNGKVGKDHSIKCGSCGSIRVEVKLDPGHVGEWDWVEVRCKKCGALLYYNGA